MDLHGEDSSQTVTPYRSETQPQEKRRITPYHLRGRDWTASRTSIDLWVGMIVEIAECRPDGFLLLIYLFIHVLSFFYA